MPWQDAVQEAPGGTRILLETTAGARHATFPDGHDPWRGRIGIRVRARALEGAANREVVDAVAAFFGVPRAAVELEAGARDTRKTIRIAGLSPDDVRARLEAHL